MGTERDKKAEKGDNMNAVAVEKVGYKKLNMSLLNFADKVVSTEEALKDATPIQWVDDVLTGKKEVNITKQ